MEHEIALTLLSQRPMMFQYSEEIQDCVGALETAVDDAVGHGLPPECAKVSRDIVFAPTLTYSVGHCWAIHLCAWSP